MPSPVGHTIVGFYGFILFSRHIRAYYPKTLLFVAVLLANLPDIDIIPGLLIGDPRLFHRQSIHSLTAAAITGLCIAILIKSCKLRCWKSNRINLGIWGAGLYASHLFLDMLVDDGSAPYGVQLLWPFSDAYFILPIHLFAGFHYFDTNQGILSSLLSVNNFFTVLQEIVILVFFIGCIWILVKKILMRYLFSR